MREYIGKKGRQIRKAIGIGRKRVAYLAFFRGRLVLIGKNGVLTRWLVEKSCR